MTDDWLTDDWRPLPALPDDMRPIIRLRLPEAAPAPASELETRIPIRAPSRESDVLVPLAQALISALAAGIALTLLAWTFAWTWRVPVIAGAVTLIGGWLWRLRQVDALLWRVETLTQSDLNHNRTIRNPAAVPVLVNPLEAQAQVARTVRDAEATARRRSLMDFAHRCFLVGTSERAHGVLATGPDRAQYLAMREALMALGLATWRNSERPRGGWVMTSTPNQARATIAKHTA